VGWVVAEVAAGRSPSVALHRYQNYCASTSASASDSPSTWFGSLPLPYPLPIKPIRCSPLYVRVCSACSYDAPVGTEVLSLLRKEFHASRLSTDLRT
jgi:meiotic recombination protein SPO11